MPMPEGTAWLMIMGVVMFALIRMWDIMVRVILGVVMDVIVFT